MTTNQKLPDDMIEDYGPRKLSVEPTKSGGSLIVLRTVKLVPDVLEITAKEREQLIRWLSSHPIPFTTVA